MIEANDVEKTVNFCRENLDIATTIEEQEPPYANIPLCVIDSVFSISVRYSSTQKVVQRFCDRFGIMDVAKNHPPNQSSQLSVKDFLAMYDEHGIEGMTGIYQNRQRTSTKNGILKSEAVLLFSQAITSFDVDYLQDIEKIFENPEFEAKIKQIPGQKSGISLRYFYMLVGSEDYVKPDRMLERFTKNATGKTLDLDEIMEVIVKACAVLKTDYPSLTPKSLDHIIWNYQRSFGSS